jgi:hypothetical protein
MDDFFHDMSDEANRPFAIETEYDDVILTIGVYESDIEFNETRLAFTEDQAVTLINALDLALHNLREQKTQA